MQPDSSDIESALENAFDLWVHCTEQSIDRAFLKGEQLPQVGDAQTVRASFESWVSSIVQKFVSEQDWEMLAQDLEARIDAELSDDDDD